MNSKVKTVIVAGVALQVTACASVAGLESGEAGIVASPGYMLDHTANFHHFMVD